MERTILTKRNAHRVGSVRNIENPEWGEWPFKYQEQKLSNDRYADVIGVGPHSKVLSEDEYHLWEVVSYKYPVLLEEFDEAAYRAFYWTSFSPDRRGIQTIMGHEAELNEDLMNIPEEEQKRYITNYKKYFSAWLSAHANCASSAITGGSNFNVRRAEKANNREHDRMQNFIEWRKKALNAIRKKNEAARPEEEKQAEAWTSLKNAISRSAETIVQINRREYPGSKALFVSSIYNKVETFAKRGDVEIVEKALALIRECNKTSSVITERHKFFKLDDLAREYRNKQEEAANKESVDYTFDGGIVRLNFADQRLQILFDEKPDRDMISTLKSNGFRWAPSVGAWQRQLTNNAKYAAVHYLGLPNLNTSKQ